MTTRTRPRIRVYPEALPGAGPTVVIGRRLASGRTVERELGQSGRLSLEEAARVLGRSRTEVQDAVRTGFLRVRRRGGRISVALGACLDFLREEDEDRQIARARKQEPSVPAIVARRSSRPLSALAP